MDESRFDELSRALGDATTRRAGLKAALGALLGGAAGAAALEAEAKRRRDGGKDAETDRKKRRKKKCKPACADGQSCVKGACVCDNGGPVCGANCCAIGQRCEGGQCVSDPQPGQCIAAGEPCKATGRACCDGRVCASGQGGEADVACYVAKTGACASTADCVYGMSCRGGVCSRPEDADGLGTPCSSASQQACSHPGAVCTPYTGAGAPNGAFCTLPLQRSCSGDPECTCYKCWYSNASPAGTARSGRASANTRACCHVPGQGCGSDGDCCLGLSCVNGTCAGTMCVPDDQPADMPGCDAATPCCNPAATCTNGTCTTCGPATCPNGCCRDGVCQQGNTAGACGTGGLACAVCTGANAACGTSNTCIVTCQADTDCGATTPVCVANTCKTCPVDSATKVASGTSASDNAYRVYGVAYSANSALVGKEVWYQDQGDTGAGNTPAGRVVFMSKTGTGVTKGTNWGARYVWGVAFANQGEPVAVSGSADRQTYYLDRVDRTNADKGAQLATWSSSDFDEPRYVAIRGSVTSTAATAWLTGRESGATGFGYVARFAQGSDTTPKVMYKGVCGATGGQSDAMQIQYGPAQLLYVACRQSGKVVVLRDILPNEDAQYTLPTSQVVTEFSGAPDAVGLAIDPQSDSDGRYDMYVSSGDDPSKPRKVYRYKLTLKIVSGEQIPEAELFCVYDFTASDVYWPMGIAWQGTDGGALWMAGYLNNPSVPGETSSVTKFAFGEPTG